MRLGRLLLAGSMLAMAGCASKGPERPPDYARCLGVLEKAQARFDPIADFGDPGGCGISKGVKLQSAAIDLSSPLQMTCNLAEALLKFEKEVVQPAAMRHFGQAVVRIHHMGGYVCRKMNNGRQNAGLSMHASGRAIDIGSFELRDGSRVSVLRDWRGGGAKQRFLHEIGERACRIFTLVLTPNHDRLHKDHFHFDIGPHRLCSL